MFSGLPQKKIEISGSEKCILVDPGDGFAMDNGESKKPSGLIGGFGTHPTLPLDLPLLHLEKPTNWFRVFKEYLYMRVK